MKSVKFISRVRVWVRVGLKVRVMAWVRVRCKVRVRVII